MKRLGEESENGGEFGAGPGPGRGPQLAAPQADIPVPGPQARPFFTHQSVRLDKWKFLYCYNLKCLSFCRLVTIRTWREMVLFIVQNCIILEMHNLVIRAVTLPQFLVH